MTQISEGQSLTLATESGQSLTTVQMAVGWEHTHTAGFAGSGAAAVDLDASAVQFAGGQFFDIAFFNNLATRDGSVVHLGDNTTGKGEGDDETISVDLPKVYAKSTRSCSSSAATRGTRWSTSATLTAASSTTRASSSRASR